MFIVINAFITSRLENNEKDVRTILSHNFTCLQSVANFHWRQNLNIKNLLPLMVYNQITSEI